VALSTAIYGRAGVVSWFDPVGWRAFDARDPANEDLYLRWLQAQPVYRDAVLTVHSNQWLHQLRNFFREEFDIDVVLFHPDERDVRGWYTNPTQPDSRDLKSARLCSAIQPQTSRRPRPATTQTKSPASGWTG
jgi:hypothetical protein